MVLREIDYPIDSVHYWTDSMSVIRYIFNESTRFHTFVSNRLAVIRDGSEPNQWNYVESSVNPADCASRGVHMARFLESEEWFSGPTFLRSPQTEWPQLSDKQPTLQEDDPEVKKVAYVTATVHQPSSSVDDLVKRHSNWLRLRAVMAWVLVAKEKFKRLRLNRSQTRPNISKTQREELLKSTSLTMENLKDAEIALAKYAQRQHFAPEIDRLAKQHSTTVDLPKGSALRKLDPVLVEGVLRVGGRLSRADIQFDVKHQIILPKESYVSQLYLEHIHRTVGHLGRNSMLAALRKKYWITGASVAIKKLVSRCVVCRKYQARASQQKMADLPKDRVTGNQPPFTAVGMDYFGPFEIKRGRSLVKRYGVIFTCLASRAVHLELASSLTTDSCIHAIRRLISRRGPVEIIRSDNGTNLVGSERELREEIQRWNQSKIHQTLQQRNITWIFNPPAGSHHGGVWERLIRIIRKILYSLLRQQTVHLNDESLSTLFCEIEAILNGRPITEVPSDHKDLEALTPDHLLKMRTGENLPPGNFGRSDNYVSQRWRQVQYLADVFWKRWTSEYLPLLQQKQKWLQPRRNVAVEDIVLVMDNTPRNSWNLGSVLEVVRDRKGVVRSAKIRTKSAVINRPITKLCLILEADVADLKVSS